jgi:hypothetical protein
MKTYGGMEVSLHHYWPRHKMEASGQLHASTAFYLGKEPLVPIIFEVGWALLLVRTLLRREESLALPGIEPR